MKYSIRKGDDVVTPFDDRPCITANKLYRVLRVAGNDTIEIEDDTGSVRQYSIYTFFEADAYFTFSLYRIFKILIKFKDTLFIQ